MTQRQTGHRTRAQERIDEIDLSPARLVEQIEKLTAELDATAKERDATAKERDEYLGALQRERAEFQNFRRRTSEERERELGLAGEDLIRKVLVLADDFDRAIAGRPEALVGDGWADGIAAIDRKLRALLESEGVSPIEADPGEAFDPRRHEAIANIPSAAHPEGTIVDEVRRGYRLRDRVIRPALVAVATRASSDDDQADSGTSGPIH